MSDSKTSLKCSSKSFSDNSVHGGSAVHATGASVDGYISRCVATATAAAPNGAPLTGVPTGPVVATGTMPNGLDRGNRDRPKDLLSSSVATWDPFFHRRDL